MSDGPMDGGLTTDGGRIDYERRMPKRPQPTEIRFRGPDGVLQKAELVVREEPLHRHGLAMRAVTVDGAPLLQKYIPALPSGGVNQQAYIRLDAEARALCRLAQVYVTRFPAELPKIFGYNVDVVEPFLLIEPLHGRPLLDVIRQFEASDRVAFQQGLLRGLALVEQSGFVHGAVELGSLRWDGVTVQLVDFDAARPRDNVEDGIDVVAAGTVIRKVTLGPRINSDTRGDPPALQQLLAGVFDQHPANRPSLRQLLERLHTPPPQVPFTRPEAAFDAARREFDEMSARKRGPSTPPMGTPATTVRTPLPAQASSRRSSALFIGMLVLLVIVVTAVVVFRGMAG